MKKLLLLVAATGLLFASCTKEDENIVKMKSSGYIKGTIVGQNADGVACNETYSYSKYMSNYSDRVYSRTTGGDTFDDISISRSKDASGENRAYISISLKNGKPIAENTDFGIRYEKLTTGNKVLSFSDDSFSPETGKKADDYSFESFTYDAASGNVKGKFTAKLIYKKLNQDGSTTDRKVTVTIEFDTKVYQEAK